MATAAPAVSKKEEGILLRTQAAALDKEIVQLTSKLATAQAALDRLESRRRELAEAAADGKPQASTADLHAKIADAKMPIEVLQNRLSEKQAARNQVGATLDVLEREIQAEKYEASRRAHVDALTKKAPEVAAEITAALSALITTKLSAYDAIRRQLGDIVNAGILPNLQPAPGLDGELAAQARIALAAMQSELFDGAVLRAERKLLREGYEPLPDPELVIRPMRPPRN
jgi:hypothetical protein